MKLALILAVVFCASSVKAQDVAAAISIDNIVIKDYNQVLIPVNLDNSNPIASLQFKMTLPDALEFDGKPVPSDRLEGNTVSVSKGGAVVVQPNYEVTAFKGNTGEIFAIPVKVKEGILESGKTVQVSVSNITLATPDAESISQNGFDFNVSLNPFSFKASLAPNPIVILPGAEAEVSFCLENTYVASGEAAPVAALTADMVLPNGITLVANSITPTDRMQEDADPIYFMNNKLMLTSMSDNILVKGISEGPVFTFKVKANSDFAGGEISLSNLEVSAVVGAFAVNGEVESCSVMPISAANQKAYEEVLDKIADVEKEYNEALAAAKKAYPDYDFSEMEQIIANAINEAKTGAEQALKAASVDGAEYNFAFDDSEIKAMIEELQTVPAREAANKAAYDKVIETIDALQAKYEEALAAVKEAYPDFDTAEYEEMIPAAIAQAREGAAQALAAADVDGAEFTYAFTGEDIEAMIADMQAIPAREAANMAAYNKVIDVINEVQAQYEAALAQLKEEYPEVDFAEWEEMIPGQIEEQRTGAAQALAAANEDGVEFSYPFDNGEYILTMIEEMKNYAKASAEQAALEAANAEACNAVLATIDGLQADFEAAVAEVKESYPDFEVAEYEEIVMGMLNQAREGAAQALAAANEDGVEFEFAYTGEDVQAVIEEMKTVAAREAANEAAYNDVIATIDALQAEYEAAVAEIKESHPDFDFTQWDEDIMGALNQAREGAAQALAAANEDGADFFFPYDGEDVKGMIEEMKNSVEGSAVEAIEAAVAAGKAKIFTLDGKQHNRPVVGEVNVIVRENSVSKIVIK